MRKLTVAILALFTSTLMYGQADNQKLIDLGKAYKNFMFRNDAAKEDLKELKSNIPDNLNPAAEFIIQTLTKGNKLLSETYLKRPADQTLKQIYIIRAINLNLRE